MVNLRNVLASMLESGKRQSQYIPCPLCCSNHSKKPGNFFRIDNDLIYHCYRCLTTFKNEMIAKQFKISNFSFDHKNGNWIATISPISQIEFQLKTFPISENARKYLSKRKFDIFQIKKMFIREVKSGTRLFGKKIWFDGIIIPILKSGIVYGAYIRSITAKRIMKISSTEYNFPSLYWNFRNIDRKKPLFVFESIFDAISSGIKNAISINGINFKEQFFRLCKNIVLCFDNYNYDEAARNMIWNYKSKNVKIFDWKDLPYKDFNEWAEDVDTIEIQKTIGSRTLHPNYLANKVQYNRKFANTY